ncbi:hypothetical protein L211DRAFT_865694 [Terfezia boudieri ATCC MYA-4762]|uniref:Uncharacterized protein n=1 Tax=Terfezia boudieri ATCC MYA-4762 TaxID=1051890 RepID=A0A3N4MEH7_9PEZI|nr:hypothetical protein L211DRAFT_865694 [Terfezia boudieri ATCC MYA-4762]
MQSASSSSMIPAPVSMVSPRVYKGTPQSILRVFSTTDTSIQRKTSTILREELSYYEELVQAQEATIANIQAMLQRERLEHEQTVKVAKFKHEQDMEIAKKEFEKLQEVALMALDTLAAINVCKVEHELKENQMEMAMNALQQKAMEMLAIIAENDVNTNSPVDSSSPPSYKELLDTDVEEVPVSHPEGVEDKINMESSMSLTTNGTAVVIPQTVSWQIPLEEVEASVSDLPVTYHELPYPNTHREVEDSVRDLPMTYHELPYPNTHREDEDNVSDLPMTYHELPYPNTHREDEDNVSDLPMTYHELPYSKTHREDEDSVSDLSMTYHELPYSNTHAGGCTESCFEEALTRLSADLPDLTLPFVRNREELVPWYCRAGSGSWGAYTSVIPDGNSCRREASRPSLRGATHKALKCVKKIFRSI